MIPVLLRPLGALLKRNDYDILQGGYSDATPETKMYWDYVTNLLTAFGHLKSDRLVRVNSQSVYNYGFMYNLIDLALAPLADNEFTRCKSHLKILEAGAHYLPIICSNVEPYKEFISQGLVYSSEGNWDGRIKDLLKHPQNGVKMGKVLGEYVREHYKIEKINIIRNESLHNLLD